VVAAATASTTTDNREVGRRAAAVGTHGKRGRSGARAYTNAVDGVRGTVMSERGGEVRCVCWAGGAGGGHCRGGRARYTLGRPTGRRAMDSVLPTARHQNTGYPAGVRPTDGLHNILLLL